MSETSLLNGGAPAAPALADARVPRPGDPRLPRHVAIVMDGNGRWATRQGLPRLAGHERGARAVREVVEAALERGIEVLSLYAFSAQNWSRPSEEVAGLMELFRAYLEGERERLAEQGIRMSLLGERERLPAEVQRAVEQTSSATAQARRMQLNLAVNYGGREELVHAMRRLAGRVAAGGLEPARIGSEQIEAELYLHALPPVDLLIRSGGERRLSNFLLWQSAYAELSFLDVPWPEFGRGHLDAALADYATRRRTFGGLVDPVEQE
ncbi:MAG: di-trans,poly-cis-decaprenylcistransferase [Planctomycetes bacterium]|nr:di-trans,poly-cis-decaprenylcistransferase [Planctomycetota bacterium]